MLGQYSGLLTAPQSRWPARKGELYAQREGTRASRRHLGRHPADNWTDHSHLIVDTVAPEADAAVVRQQLGLPRCAPGQQQMQRQAVPSNCVA